LARPVRFVPIFLIALLAAGCGTSGGGSTREARTAVAITVWPDGEGRGPARSAQLVCDPVAGTLPDPERACAVLASSAGRDALAPVPADVPCTEIYGGPAEARIVGTVDGEAVDARLSRANGCEIARWTALDPLLAGHDAA
jgi:hypothetical protein